MWWWWCINDVVGGDGGGSGGINGCGEGSGGVNSKGGENELEIGVLKSILATVLMIAEVLLLMMVVCGSCCSGRDCHSDAVDNVGWGGRGCFCKGSGVDGVKSTSGGSGGGDALNSGKDTVYK